MLLIALNKVLHKALQQLEFLIYCFVISVTPVSRSLLSTSLLSCKLLLMNLRFPWLWDVFRLAEELLASLEKPCSTAVSIVLTRSLVRALCCPLTPAGVSLPGQAVGRGPTSLAAVQQDSLGNTAIQDATCWIQQTATCWTHCGGGGGAEWRLTSPPHGAGVTHLWLAGSERRVRPGWEQFAQNMYAFLELPVFHLPMAVCQYVRHNPHIPSCVQ
jgi:hypothetical protein